MRNTDALRGCEIVIPIWPIRTPASRVAVTDAQPDATEGELAEVVPEAEREEDRDLRVLAQRRDEPVKHSALRCPVLRSSVAELGHEASCGRGAAFFFALPSADGLSSFRPRLAL